MTYKTASLTTMMLLFWTGLIFSQQRFFAYWGYNGSAYSASDIRLVGGDYYDLTLHGVESKDVPLQHFKDLFSGFSPYNLRVGYRITPQWSVSLGMDHMKYKTLVGQAVAVDGFVSPLASLSQQGLYDGELRTLDRDFFYAEHTDGLNYISAEVDYTAYAKEWQGGKFRLEAQAGLGLAMLVPRTESYVFGRGGNHPYHLSGYGMSVHAFPRFFLWEYAFVQATAKCGYINMPRVYSDTGLDIQEWMTQDFFFLQWNMVVGLAFSLGG